MSLAVLREALPADGAPDWLASQRRQALDALIERGFPTRRDETWKYTRSEAFEQFALAALKQPSTQSIDSAFVESLLADAGARYALVTLNGTLNDTLTRLPAGVTLGAAGREPNVVGEDASEAMRWLAIALARTDISLQVAADAVIDAPLHIVHLAADGALAQVRLSIEAGQDSRLSLVEHFASIDDAARTMHNSTLSVSLAAQAELRYRRLQTLNAESLQATRVDATLEAGAKLHTFTLDTGSRLARNDLNARLVGEHAHVSMIGLYLADGTQHIDNHTRVEHIARNTSSDEDYRGILRDRSRCVFNGKVIVHEGADGTDAAQSNPNLLLSDHAEIDTKPELEIYADEVKCSHGATVGQLDDNSLFYLRARGIDAATATQLLTFAFCRETLRDIETPALRVAMERLIADQIPEFTALDIEL